MHDRLTLRSPVFGRLFFLCAWSRVIKPWVPFDREAVIRYQSRADAGLARQFHPVNEARDAVGATANAGKWAKIPESGGEVDQLAVDTDGKLVIVELKDTSKSGVYYAPLQLLQYVWEWHNAFPNVQESL